MNNNPKFQYSIVLALATLLITTFSVWAYPAEDSELTRSLSVTTPCRVVIETAADVVTRIDIPSRRAEYAALDRIADCLRLAGAEATIPKTGRSTSAAERFLELKDRQAEFMDKSGVPASSQVDQRWMDFKDRQAEHMDRSQ